MTIHRGRLPALGLAVVCLAVLGWSDAQAKKPNKGHPHGAPPGQAKKARPAAKAKPAAKPVKKAYRYYADAGVYFDAAAKRYYYRDDSGGWRVTVRLPERIRVRLGDWVVIEAGSRPYVDYPRHQVVYPRRQGPPPHAPAHGVRKKYQYRYYPDQGIYYDMARRRYYRREGGKWAVVISLPLQIRAQLGRYVQLEMDLDRPYLEYRQHLKLYPPDR